MKRMILITAAMLIAAAFSWSQSPVSPEPSAAKPATTNAPGQEYPKVDSQGRAIFRILAPKQAQRRVSEGIFRGLRDFPFPPGWCGAQSPRAPTAVRF